MHANYIIELRNVINSNFLDLIGIALLFIRFHRGAKYGILDAY